MEGFDYQNACEYLPKIGQSKSYNLVAVKKVQEEGSPLNFRSKSKNYGYHYEIELDNGKSLILNNFGLYTKFKEAGVKAGDSIVITHVGHSEWEVEVVNE